MSKMLGNILVIVCCLVSGHAKWIIDQGNIMDQDLQSPDQEVPRLLPNTPLFYIDDMIYYVGNNTKATFVEAVQICEMMNMRLATVDSERLNTKLYQYMSTWSTDHKTFWVSGSNMIDGETWIWMTTGEHIEYFNWGEGQPNGQTQIQYCLLLRFERYGGLEWYDTKCEIRHPYICEVPNDLDSSERPNKENPSFTHTKDTPCSRSSEGHSGDLPLIQKNGMAYYIETRQKLPQDEAEAFCNDHQMQLVTINNGKENSILGDILIRYAKKDGPFWTAGKKRHYFGSWNWGDEKLVEYFNWTPGEPNYVGLLDDCMQCIEIYSNDNTTWNDEYCTSRRNFICQKHEESGDHQKCTN